MRKIALLFSALIISGCATNAPKETALPIFVPCKVETPADPTYRYAPPYDSVYDAVRDLLGDVKVRDGYEGELKAAIRSCK